MSKLSSLSIVFIVIHITSFLVSSQSPSDTTHTSAITTNVDTICSYGDTGQVIHCNLCSDPSDFRIEHDCIACLDSMWYGLMMILLCSFTLLMSMMLILFHAPMAYRIVSIYLWIQIAAIVFYRASAVFAPIHKRWAFLSTITVFSTSIWKSKCGCHDHVWDQGTSFGIVFIQCVILFMLFFFCTYLHHWFRHSQYSQFTQFARYQYQYQCACKRCYKALINALTVFEKRWQYQGKSNGNNNDEDDGIEDEHGSFVDANPSSPRPGQHPIHPPMTSQLGAPNPSSKGSPTITPVTLEHLKHDTVKKMTSPKPLQLGDNASSQASRPISSTITRSPPQKHLGPPNFKSRMHTPSSNLGTMYTNTDDHDMSAASQSTSNHESYSAIQFQKGKKKHYRHKSISSLTDDHLPTIKEISPVLVAAANNMHSPPSVQSMQSGSVSASGSIPFAMAPPSCVTAEPSTTDHDAKGSQQSMIKKFDNNEGNRLESVVEDQMSPLAIQMHAKDDDMVLTDSMNENMEYKTDVSLLMLAHTPTQSTHNEFDHEEGKTDQHFSFPPQAHAPSASSQSPSKLHKVMKVQIFKDERAFDYVGADPNAALSDGTYYYMVDLTQNPIHSRSASQFDPSRQNDYPPQVATVFSQTEEDKPVPVPNGANAIATNGGSETQQQFALVSVDSQPFQTYIREEVDRALGERLKSAGYDEEVKSHSTKTLTKREASPASDLAHHNPSQSPPVSRPTHDDLDMNQFVFEYNLKKQREVAFEMAFNTTFLMCSPLILQHALQVMHCVDTEDGISIRSNSQYVCADDFWHYFGVFIMVGWFVYVAMSIYRGKQFVKQIVSATDNEVLYRHAFGDSFRFFWMNNVKLSKWWYGFIPILLQFLVILSSVVFDDVNYAMMLIALLLWFEFVVMCCIRPYLTASDRLCQFALRTCVLFESSMMVIAVHDSDEDHSLEPLNVAICCVIFVTLIISHFAACSGLYPIHPSSTVCSSCCCCCCFCLEPLHDDDSDEEDEDDDSDAIRLQIAAMNSSNMTSDIGSDRPLLNQQTIAPPGGTALDLMLANSNSSHKNSQRKKSNEKVQNTVAQTIKDENDTKDNSSNMYTQMSNYNKQHSTNTITPYPNAPDTTATRSTANKGQRQAKGFNFASAKNEAGVALPQNHTAIFGHYNADHTGVFKHYNSETRTDTQRSNSGMPSDLGHSMIDLQLKDESHDQDLQTNVVVPSLAPYVASNSSVASSNTNQTQAPQYNRLKSDSRYSHQSRGTSVISLNSFDSNTKTNTQQHQ
eukprot:310858_1